MRATPNVDAGVGVSKPADVQAAAAAVLSDLASMAHYVRNRLRTMDDEDHDAILDVQLVVSQIGALADLASQELGGGSMTEASDWLSSPAAYEAIEMIRAAGGRS